MTYLNSNEAEILRGMALDLVDVPIGSYWKLKKTKHHPGLNCWAVERESVSEPGTITSSTGMSSAEGKWRLCIGNRYHLVTDGVLIVASPVKMTFIGTEPCLGVAALADGAVVIWVTVEIFLKKFARVTPS